MAWAGVNQLIARVKSGDTAALDQLLGLIEPYLAQLQGVPQRRGLTEASAEDVSQSVRVQLWHSIESFHGADTDEATSAMLRKWLRVTMQNRARNHVRDRNAKVRRPDVPLERLDDDASDEGRDVVSGDATPSMITAAAETANKIDEAIAALGPLDQSMLQLRYQAGLPYHEIGARLGLSLEQVRYRLQQLHERLRTQLPEG